MWIFIITTFLFSNILCQDFCKYAKNCNHQDGRLLEIECDVNEKCVCKDRNVILNTTNPNTGLCSDYGFQYDLSSDAPIISTCEGAGARLCNTANDQRINSSVSECKVYKCKRDVNMYHIYLMSESQCDRPGQDVCRDPAFCESGGVVDSSQEHSSCAGYFGGAPPGAGCSVDLTRGSDMLHWYCYNPHTLMVDNLPIYDLSVAPSGAVCETVHKYKIYFFRLM